MSENEDSGKHTSSPQEHMANERTFLAWIRTSIALMAFGFVVQRFALFLENFSLILRVNGNQASEAIGDHSTYWGIIMVGFGALICLFAYVRYRKIARQIDSGSYQRIGALDLLLTSFVLGVGISLIIYLLEKM